MGTCRIFLAPKFDERGLPWLLRDQKHLMVEMDKFTVNCKISNISYVRFLLIDLIFLSVRQGMNNITRRSDESSVTIPFNRTFRDLDASRPAEGSEELAIFNFCGCGWPQHMLVPRGNAETNGFACELFVMISNYADDRVSFLRLFYSLNNPFIVRQKSTFFFCYLPSSSLLIYFCA